MGTRGLAGVTPQTVHLAPGHLLIAPADAGPASDDVLCVFDRDKDEAGALFALVLNQRTEQPAQPLAFGLFACGDERAWWGGPTSEPFALVELTSADGPDDRAMPSGEPRPYVTSRTALFLPGRDHAPSTPGRLRVFAGSVWLSADQAALYAEEGFVVSATDDALFDDEPETLADRLRVTASDG